MTLALEKEVPVDSTSSKPAPEQSKDKTKGPEKQQKSPKNNQGKSNWHRPYPQGYRIPKWEPLSMDSVFSMARTIMGFTAKEEERMNSSVPHR
ncbi:hypothetical protein O181_079761 [Austropuccinia psidii MF-1]|uniref:Uncharacterized protein n=1 Tax=Austropuccinia psidii MF-1 TaxID=1389203 RepID=A0A9Q3FGW7_9BASI|nr:hypothetical protein [Austropuccinia psidii MF-1]